ncbi:MAG: alpha-1,4-glucan--maltose-1-phosphate maltosyltransferase [Mycobacteriales bacterium]
MIGRIPILAVTPVVDCGRWPAKAVVGERLSVAATVFREGHGQVGATLVLRDPKRRSTATRMSPIGPGSDRFQAELVAETPGTWRFWIEGWADPLATWRHDAQIKIAAAQDIALALEEGARLHERAAAGMPRELRALIKEVARKLRTTSESAQRRLDSALDPTVVVALEEHPLRDLVTRSEQFSLLVERKRALFGAWYEFFPRSEGAHRDGTGRWISGSLRTAAERLPAVAAMGFDVVYLPPIHPIGESFRKGANNALEAAADDPGSPWAIGSSLGGHDAIHPDLGNIEDFDAFVARAGSLGLEVALDLALQCSPEHPWLREHPEWFATRPDGTIAYAENPPKKYQDIYPLYFDNDPEGLSQEVLRVVRHWLHHGVRIFRVDNPHTKPVWFWEWLIAEVHRTDPDVIWLAEAFTRPAMMQTLAKVGFTQSYTYFTWRTDKGELQEYLSELSGPSADFMRPNLFVNTPDILSAYLQYGGPPAFKIRATLAALLSPTWGVYSGFELFEHVAVRPGSEEYLDSEKYAYRPRDWQAAEAEGRSLAPFITKLNDLRRRHSALQSLRNVRFHSADVPEIMAWSKSEPSADGASDVVLVVINLDPHSVREATVSLDMPALGADWQDTISVHDELSGETYRWGAHNYVRLDPFVSPAHVFTVQLPGTTQ